MLFPTATWMLTKIVQLREFFSGVLAWERERVEKEECFLLALLLLLYRFQKRQPEMSLSFEFVLFLSPLFSIFFFNCVFIFALHPFGSLFLSHFCSFFLSPSFFFFLTFYIVILKTVPMSFSRLNQEQLRKREENSLIESICCSSLV